MRELCYCFDCEKFIEPLQANYSDIGIELGCPSCRGGNVGCLSDTEALRLFKGQTDVPNEIVELREEYILAGIWEYDMTDEIAEILIKDGDYEFLKTVRQNDKELLQTE